MRPVFDSSGLRLASAAPLVDLRAAVRRGFRLGRLFAITHQRVWAGPARGGQQCHVCERGIGRRVMEYEVDAPDGQVVFAHVPCWFAWMQHG